MAFHIYKHLLSNSKYQKRYLELEIFLSLLNLLTSKDLVNCIFSSENQ